MKKRVENIEFLTPNFQIIRSENVEVSFEKYKLDKKLIPMIKKESSKKRRREEEVTLKMTSSPKLRREVSKVDKDKTSATNYLPMNWTIEHDDSGKMVFCAPEGDKFKSRIEALQFMKKMSYDAHTLLRFWNSLEEEGWSVLEDRIPSGWRARYCPDILDYRYLTPDLTLLRGTEEASTSIQDTGDFVQIIKFESWAAEVQRQAPALAWAASDPALPPGWSLASDRDPEILRSGSGARFAGRREAVQFMIRAGCNPEDIFRLWSSLAVEGWESDEANLPREWRRRYDPATRSHHYLSPMMDIVTSEAELLSLVEDGYTQEDRGKVINWVASL